MRTPFALSQIMKAKTIEDEARAFAEWLNFEGELEDEICFVVKLVAGSGKTPPPFNRQEMARMLKAVDQHDRSDPGDVYDKEINRIIGRIEKKYPSRLQLVGWDGKLPLFARVPIPPLRRDSLAACVALDTFQRFAGIGMLATIKWCDRDDCNAPFFTLRSKKRYCCDECQRIDYGRSPERKKKNLEYQKIYYQRHLSVDAKRREVRLEGKRRELQRSRAQSRNAPLKP